MFSCSENNDLVKSEKEVVLTEKPIIKSILKFNSIESVSKRIDSIKKLKEEKEREFFGKILLKNNLTNSDLEQVKKGHLVSFKTNNLKFENLKKDVVFYHTEKLKAIYEIRSELNFISIQSIADEINYLKLLNPNKHKHLFNEYKGLLTKDEFLVYPIVNSKIAEILNTKGEYLLNDEEISVLMNNQNSKNKNRDPIDLKSGVLANNGQFTVTYHAGWRSGGTSINDTDFLYSELKSFLTIGDTYLPYPCSFFASPDSKSTFHKSAFEAVANLGVRKVVSFRSFNVGVSSLNEVPYFSYYNGSYNSLSYARGHITDTFIFPVSGGAVTITGSVNF